MAVKLVLLSKFQGKMEDRKYKSHVKIVLKLIEKLKRMGRNSLKILDVEDYYLLCEMKIKRPPYRLYVIVDQKNDTYYIADWEHKGMQEKVINELKTKLSSAISFGLDKIFT